MTKDSFNVVQQLISDNEIGEAHGQAQMDQSQQPSQQHQQEPSQPPRIYHERQSRQLCALHALNNLFQSPQAFTKQELDAICKELAPDAKIFNPHRSFFGLGCYDVNVVIAALNKRGYDVKWFDRRKDVTCLNLEKIFGLILNVPNTPSDGLFSIPLNYIPIQAQIWSTQKHWIAIRKIGSFYYNLDSKLVSPQCIGNVDALYQYLKFKSFVEPIELLIVVRATVSEDDSWLKKDPQSIS